MEQAAKHVVVVQKVFAVAGLVIREGCLQLLKHAVELLQQCGPGLWWLNERDPLDNLQPLFDVKLHVQRSEYSSDDIFVDNGVATVAEAFSNE